MRRRRGITLLELLLALTMLAAAVGVAFGVFHLGSFYFHLGLMRQSLQNDGRRALTLLERDLRQSCLDGISSGMIRDSQTQPRHALSVPGLNDWDFKGNFDFDSGVPLFNRFILYYANLGDPGKLFRMEIQPTTPISPKRPWDNFPTNTAFGASPWQPGPPGALGGVVAPIKTQTLSDQVVAFAVSQSGSGTVEVSLRLRGQAQGAERQNDRDEVIQLNLYCPVYIRQ